MAIVNGMIKCSRCREFKVLELFPKAAAKQGSGSCKVCALEYSNAWREQNRERVAEQRRKQYAARSVELAKKAREHRAKVRAKCAESPEAKRLRTEQTKGYALKQYGMTLECFNKLLVKQGGGCAICGKHANPKGYCLAVDHCHESGRIRGILCTNCNRGLGLFRDSTDLIKRAIEYLT
ncbi:endonuclease VII domain-containing protein [Pseudomonas fluorescens]|nr:endonuclease VII domain-containing protein [Pseudomonas fluorescens]